MARYDAVFSPIRLRNLELKNRIFSAAHATGYLENGLPGERYLAYHEEKAKGGIGHTVIGGSSGVAFDSGAIYGQIYVGNDEVIPWFKKFSKVLHGYDCGVLCQITHMGRRSTAQSAGWLPTVAPSALRDPAHGDMPREAEQEDIHRIVKAFGDAAARCQEGGLDGCEVLASVHLVGQFLSPLSNLRKDGYGGCLENRFRFLHEVLAEIRRQVGEDFVVGVRYTADESNENGLSRKEGIEIGRLIGQSGLTDFVHVNGTYGGTPKGMSETFPGMGNPSAPFLELAGEVRRSSGLPTAQAARITDLSTANFALEAGHLDLVGMVRPHFADPHLVRNALEKREERTRPCVGAGLCFDRASRGGDVICTYNVSTGRERDYPVNIERASSRKKVVVVGGGPAGMELARVCAERGHNVVLMEANKRLGGQIVLASMASWRRDLIGIADWLVSELGTLGVDIRTNTFAGANDVVSESPDVVVVATGGLPFTHLDTGGDEHCRSVWDVLTGDAPNKHDEILIYDEVSSHAAISLAAHLSSQGMSLELVTPGTHVGAALGGLTHPQYMEILFENDVTLTPNHTLAGVNRQGNGFEVTLKNGYTRMKKSRQVSFVVVDQGTTPNIEIFGELVDRSSNNGILYLDAMREVKPQPVYDNAGFALYKIGDALAGRDIYSAILDGNRLARNL
jgi:2,4-dienoyl-CoA reductase-like NADH-dependent reductase (Old Yellow Enzyme family)